MPDAPSLAFDCTVTVGVFIDTSNRFAGEDSYYGEVHLHSQTLETAFVYSVAEPHAPHYDPLGFAQLLEIVGLQGLQVLSNTDPYSERDLGSEDRVLGVDFPAHARITYESQEVIHLSVTIDGTATLVHRWKLATDPLNFVILATQLAAHGIDCYESIRSGVIRERGDYYFGYDAPF